MAAGHGRGEETLRPPQGEAEPHIPRGTGHVRSHTPHLVLFKLRCNGYITPSFPPSLSPSICTSQEREVGEEDRSRGGTDS